MMAAYSNMFLSFWLLLFSEFSKHLNSPKSQTELRIYTDAQTELFKIVASFTHLNPLC